MSKVYIFDHPLIQHKVALMRKTDTSTKDFRELAKEIAMLMGFEAPRYCNRADSSSRSWFCRRYAGACSKCKGWSCRTLPRS